MTRPVFISAIYTLAFVLALVAVRITAALGARTMFEDSPERGLLIFNFLAPLAGICVFAVIYGFASGKVLKLREWMVALLAVGGVLAISRLLTQQGIASILPVLFFKIALIYVLGFVFALKRDARDAS